MSWTNSFESNKSISPPRPSYSGQRSEALFNIIYVERYTVVNGNERVLVGPAAHKVVPQSLNQSLFVYEKTSENVR